MGLTELLFRNPGAFALIFIPLTYSVILHEIAHGAVAYLLGDDTAKRAGRLSINPLRHLDPFGLLALLLIGFGWAKPVPIDYSKLRNSRLAFIAVALAGCVVNFIIAFVAMFLLEIDVFKGSALARYTLMIVSKINVILAAFNLIPLPPLDGSKVLFVLLPEKYQRVFIMMQPFVVPVLIILLFTGSLDFVVRFGEMLLFDMIKFLMPFIHR